jgi:hypothetical protein
MAVSHCLKMVKKGHPSPGFEPTPLEGSKKVKNFCLKLYHWATEASYNTGTEIQIFIANNINSLSWYYEYYEI